MKIAIQAADLDHARIDGTRVYIHNLLKRFGALSPEDEFLIYHRNAFNPHLAVGASPNYAIRQIPFPILWTQTRFAWKVWRDTPDVLWMPMHNLPMFRSKSTKTFITVHDLAFKLFPSYFPPKMLRRLNTLADFAIGRADKIIAVSQATKNDILKFYPARREEDIRVVHHGYDDVLFCLADEATRMADQDILRTYGLCDARYLLYVGAIQPRKNIGTLIAAFEKAKETVDDLVLVIVGEKAWLWEETVRCAESSRNAADIIFIGQVSFAQLPTFYRNAQAFIFPSRYEGFGIPVLESMACGTPVIAARNSSLPEVGGDAAEYFDTDDIAELGRKITSVVCSQHKHDQMVSAGIERIKKFSWDSSAKETLDFFHEA